ncbi:MAG: (2Fe-2S)-binding protein [Myxococcota bacterium]|jgi:carbon-monoxide dehydrogenase small subunit|nr:(2Fe-2S)-binding protein [Myxococcota bacterium]
MKQVLSLNINGHDRDVMVSHEDLLVDVLRDQLGLIGTKKGCGHGSCGTCTVIIDGEAVLSCLTLALSSQGKKITTIEGIEKDGALHPLQQSFIERGAVQCGFCTPGMIMSAAALLSHNKSPSIEEIKIGLSGNLCRCTGYVKIVDAVEVAAAKMRQLDAAQKGA